jgi:glyoxylase-like metal-dependent hydrolase (beta-lactamase superfamily II)
VNTEVYALRYASRPEALASENFYQHGLYGEPDAAIGMDYFFWLIRTGGKHVVVDCGFGEDLGPTRNRWFSTPPSTLLARMGVDPATVDHVVLSHMHFDHVGNTHLFPNATFHMARAEVEYWAGRHRDVPAFSWPVEDREVRRIEQLYEEERLRFVEDSAELGSTGIRVDRYPGHTPGSLVTTVDHGAGTVVLASDAMHYLDETRLNRPFCLFTDLATMLDSYAALRELGTRPGVDVVPGHDPAVTAGYVEVAQDCLDLTHKKEDA